MQLLIDFGEITVWIGVYLLCVGGYDSVTQRVLGLLSPLFVFSLLVYLSGVPLLERAGAKRWGDDAAYKAYIQNTPVLVPFIGRCGNAPF